MATELIHIGFGNYVSANQMIGVASPGSAPIKRLIHEGRAKGMTIDMTSGRRTKAVVFMGNGAGGPADHAFLTFLSEQEFDRLLAEDGLLEHAQVYDYRYGVPKAPVRQALERGQDVVMRVDVQGAATIKKLAPAAILIFLTAPSFDELEERLRARGLDDDATINKRLEKAAWERAQVPKFDYLVVNERDRLDDAPDP